MDLFILILENAIKNAGEYEDIRISREDAESILMYLKEYKTHLQEDLENLNNQLLQKETEAIFQNAIFNLHQQLAKQMSLF